MRSWLHQLQTIWRWQHRRSPTSKAEGWSWGGAFGGLAEIVTWRQGRH